MRARLVINFGSPEFPAKLLFKFIVVLSSTILASTTHKINCFVGKSVVITDSLPHEWIHASWKKSKMEMNPTVGVIQGIGPFTNFDQSKYKILNDGNSLEIKSCGFTDAGEYRLGYYSRSGQSLSKNIYNISIYKKPDAPIMKKKGEWLRKGVVLESEVKQDLASCQTKSIPRAKHVWVDQDGEEYGFKEKVSGLRNDTLISTLFLRPHRSLKGKKFTCKAEYKLSENNEQFRSQIVTALNVYFRPDPPLIRVDQNRTKLICESEASPKAEIKWVVYDSQQQNGTDLIVDSVKHSELLINSRLFENLSKTIGNRSYLSCEAQNSVGIAKRTQNVPDLIMLTGGGNPITKIIKQAKAWTKTQTNETLVLVLSGLVGTFLIVIIGCFMLCRKTNKKSHKYNDREVDARPFLDSAPNSLMDAYRGDFTVNGSEFSYRQQQQARLMAHREANSIPRNINNHSIITGNTLVPQNPVDNPNKNIVYNQLPVIERANSTSSSRATRQSIIRRKQEHAKARTQEFSDSDDDDDIPPVPQVLPPKTPSYHFEDPMQEFEQHFTNNGRRIQDYYHTQTSNI